MVNNKNALKKVIEHPDRDEIISKLIIGISAKDIHEWLVNTYSNPAESKFVVSVKSLQSFASNYLDIYDFIKKDLIKTKQAVASSNESSLMLAVQDNPTYKSKMLQLASNEIDIKKMLANLIFAIETRAAQIFDKIQEDPREINSSNDRVLIEYFDQLGTHLEKWHKLVLGAPDQVIQHNITVQHIDQQIQVFHEAIRETLAEIDIETSMRFMEIFNNKINKLNPKNEKELNTEARLAEAKIISETMLKKLNEGANV